MALTTVLDRTPTATLALRFARLEVEGLGRKLARALGIGLRLFAEAYSRVSFAPSPIPETRAREAARGR